MIKHTALIYDSGNKPTWNLIISKMLKVSNKILNKLNPKEEICKAKDFSWNISINIVKRKHYWDNLYWLAQVFVK